MQYGRRTLLPRILAAGSVSKAGLLLGLALALGFALIPSPRALANDFARVLEGYRIDFPEDSGAHPDFRTEWWYITGWITDDQGHERGFQVTFFRIGTGIGADNPSRFAPRQLIIAHAALADPASGHLLHAERAERALDPISGAAVGRTHAWIADWSLSLKDDTYRTIIQTDRFDLDLTLIPSGPPLLNGQAGFSQKTPDPANASYYYSRPQLAVNGKLRLDDQSLYVNGSAWLDHEWSSEILPDNAQGWDWIGMNLYDGGSLMAFACADPMAPPFGLGVRLRQGGKAAQILAPDQLRFKPGRLWQSPRTGADYPVEWEIEANGRRFALRPLMDDQELDGRSSTGNVYWEGATRLFEDGREIGRGYLEMTGYWQKATGL